MFTVVQRAVESGDAHQVGIVLATLSWCTTPGSIIVIPALLIWLWVVRPERRPRIDDSPQAMMSAALQLERRGNVAAAIAKYEEVMRRFAGTETARDAEVSIRSLRARVD